MGKKYVPEQVAEKLGYYYQNGWNLLFEAGQQMQDDVLMDIISLGNNSAYAQEHGSVCPWRQIYCISNFWFRK